MNNSVIFITNDFGYGPTSHALALAKCLKEKGVEVKLVTAQKNDAILAESGIPIEHVTDLRNVDTMTAYFKQNESQLIVSVMNRFAIQAANTLNRKIVIIDDLFWFWRPGSRPIEYSNADLQIRCVLPWHLADLENTDGVAYATIQADEFTTHKSATRDGSVLMSLNGLRTPFYTPAHDVYAEFMGLVAKALSQYHDDLVITGPDYIKPVFEATLPSTIQYQSLSKSDYLIALSSAPSVYLNGGSNSFYEAIMSNTPISSILPSNQSQYAFTRAIAASIGVPVTQLCPLLTLIPHHEEMLNFTNEKDAIDNWSRWIQDFLNSDDAFQKIQDAVAQQVANPVDIKAQFPKWQTLINNNPSIDGLLWDYLKTNA